MKNFSFLFYIILLLNAKPANSQVFEVSTIVDTSGIGIGHFEPDTHTYDFVAPLNSSLLCKNGHQLTIPSTVLNGLIPAGTYEDETGNISSSGQINSPDQVWFIAEESIDLTANFVNEEGSLFSAEIKNEGSFCDTPLVYTAGYHNRYFMSFFGPRMRASSGNILALYDYHRGEDINDKEIPTSDFPDLFCLCDGIVDRIFDEDDLEMGEDIEDTGTGRYVTVKCDSSFNGNPDMGNIFAATRHMSEINPALVENDPISKGTVLGKLGESGITSTPHLHFSIQKENAMGHKINVHPMRVYNPAYNVHLLQVVDGAPFSAVPAEQAKEVVNIELLDSDNTSAMTEDNFAIFRVAIPYRKASIRAIILRNMNYQNRVDFEEISELRDGNTPWLDDPIINDSLTLFVYPFNRGLKAYDRFESIEVDLMNYTHTGNDFPLEDEGIFQTPAFVLDLKITQLPMGFDWEDFEVDVLDVWGHGVRGVYVP